MEDLIDKKITELIELCEIENDNHTSVVLMILKGSRLSGDVNLLSNKLVEYTKDVLLPNIERKQILEKAMKN